MTVVYRYDEQICVPLSHPILRIGYFYSPEALRTGTLGIFLPYQWLKSSTTARPAIVVGTILHASKFLEDQDADFGTITITLPF